jgi:hypothetical protein
VGDCNVCFLNLGTSRCRQLHALAALLPGNDPPAPIEWEVG